MVRYSIAVGVAMWPDEWSMSGSREVPGRQDAWVRSPGRLVRGVEQGVRGLDCAQHLPARHRTETRRHRRTLNSSS